MEPDNEGAIHRASHTNKTVAGADLFPCFSLDHQPGLRKTDGTRFMNRKRVPFATPVPVRIEKAGTFGQTVRLIIDDVVVWIQA